MHGYIIRVFDKYETFEVFFETLANNKRGYSPKNLVTVIFKTAIHEKRLFLEIRENSLILCVVYAMTTVR